MTLILLIAQSMAMGGDSSPDVPTNPEADTSLTDNRHPISNLLQRRYGQEGQRVNDDALGGTLTITQDGNIEVKVKDGGFLISDETDGLSVDEAILASVLPQGPSMKEIQQDIDMLRSMSWTGL